MNATICSIVLGVAMVSTVWTPRLAVGQPAGQGSAASATSPQPATLLQTETTHPGMETTVTQANDIQSVKDIVFATEQGQPLTLDLYLPQSTGPAAPRLVVWIHGGGWRGGSKRRPPVRRLVEEGYALASISYRFTESAIFPAQLHDCKAAVRWLRAHEADYGYDASWIAAVGSSAGGTLALLLGNSPATPEAEGEVGGNLDQSSGVQAIVDYFGPSDFVLRGQTQPEVAYSETSGSFALLGGKRHGAIDPAMERWASPATHVGKKSPPLLVFHGTQDELVLPNQSQRIVEVYMQHGRPAQLVLVEGAGHGGSQFFWGEPMDRVLEFLRAQIPAARAVVSSTSDHPRD